MFSGFVTEYPFIKFSTFGEPPFPPALQSIRTFPLFKPENGRLLQLIRVGMILIKELDQIIILWKEVETSFRMIINEASQWQQKLVRRRASAYVSFCVAFFGLLITNKSIGTGMAHRGGRTVKTNLTPHLCIRSLSFWRSLVDLDGMHDLAMLL